MDKEYIIKRQSGAAEHILEYDVIHEKYANVQILHEMVDPDYSRLLKQRSKNKNRFVHMNITSIESIIFFDIIKVIIDEFARNDVIRKKFIEIYAHKFPRTKEIIKRVRKTDAVFLNENIPDDVETAIEYLFVIVVLGEDDEFNNLAIWRTKKPVFESSVDFREDLLKGLYRLNFPKEDESVLRSAAFKNYIRKNRDKLCEYCGCRDDRLALHIIMSVSDEVLAKDIEKSDYSIFIPPNISKQLILSTNQISNFAHSDMMYNSGFDDEIDDIDRIINDYYVTRAVREMLLEKSNFTKLYLSRECVTDDPGNDLEEIISLYNMDVLCKMYNTLMDLYYQSFSWERITGVDKNTIYRNNLKKLENEIGKLKSKIDSLSKENDSLKISNMKDKNDAIYEYEAENKRLRKQIAELTEKIGHQAFEIDSQNELIDELQNKLPDIVYDVVDIDYLKQYKYLFVCNRNDKLLSQFERCFPNSIFMNTPTKDIDLVKCDYIIFITKYISHSIYYKVKQSNVYRDVPNIMCNSTSVKSIMSEMYHCIKK